MPRAPYIPPRARPDPVSIRHATLVMSDTLSKRRTLAEFDPAECDRREQILLNALEALRKGEATDDHIGEIIDAANLAAFRMDDGDFRQAEKTIWAAKECLNSLNETHRVKGRYIAHSFELDSLTAFIGVYMDMMRASNAKEWHLARAKLIAEYQRQQRPTKPTTRPVVSMQRSGIEGSATA